MKIVDNYFGGCPECGSDDGYIDIGKSHWFFCKEHRTRWCIGANLFSSWRGESEEQQRKRYKELEFDSFHDVKPLREGTPVFQRGLCLEAIANEAVQYAGQIISTAITTICEAGDRDLEEIAHHIDPAKDAVAKILFEAIGAGLDRRGLEWGNHKDPLPSWQRPNSNPLPERDPNDEIMW